MSIKAKPDGGYCPACGGELARVHRHALDRFVSMFRSVHRYSCLNPDCGWKGVLGRDLAGDPPGGGWKLPLLWFVVGAGCALAAVQGMRVYQRNVLKTPPARAALQRDSDAVQRKTPPGQDYAGVQLPETDKRTLNNPSPLHLRRGCAWGVPGGNPYRGTVQQALTAAQLPAEVVRQISDMAARGWTYGQVEISRTGIRTLDGRREFGTYARAMAFGDNLCFSTRVNFPEGHREYAALYQASDDRGQTYTVMIPYVCQNVSVLGEREEIGDHEDVSEPGTLSLVAPALGLLAATWQWNARRRRA